MKELIETWLEAKETERLATERRRAAEDAMAAAFALAADFDGTLNATVDGYKVKVAARLDRKVYADLVQEIAAEHGLQDHLSTLFRWKPELSLTAWKQAPEDVRTKLNPAITTKPGRPSFSITKE